MPRATPTDKLACPQCGKADCGVIDSRPNQYRGWPSVRRRRGCNSCDYRWTTYEFPDEMFTRLEIETRKAVISKLLEEI